MAAYAIEEIPNLPDEAVPVIRQREKHIIVRAGNKVRKWICSTTCSAILFVLFTLLFAIFLILYIKLNGEYNDIKEENNEMKYDYESINMQNTELEIANAELIKENEILNYTLDALIKGINDDHQINNSLPNNTDTNNTSAYIIGLINKLVNENNVTKTELKILQSKFAELNINYTQIQQKFELLFEEYQTYGRYDYKETIIANKRQRIDNFAMKTYYCQLMSEIPKLKEKNGLLVNELDNIEEKIIRSEEADDPKPPNPDIKNPDPLLGFITLDSLYNAFRKYIWNSSGNSYDYSGSSMNTFSSYPMRGEMNSRGIYVLPDRYNTNIGFYDLSSFGTSPVIRSQSGYGGFWGACGFMDDIAICATRTTGDIYKYNITNNYDQVRIANNNPSGYGFHSLLITKEKQILAAYGGCIYIYNSFGHYIGYSNNSQTSGYMCQMKEIRSNIILTAEYYYVYSHDISNTGNIIRHKLLDSSDTNKYYLTLEVLEGNTGDIAIGGYYCQSYCSGYVELFHLDEDNSTLLPKSNKRWVQDYDCYIYIIREIQTGVIIFGGNYYCANICTWEYAVIPNKDPICFPRGGRDIWDIISLP